MEVGLVQKIDIDQEMQQAYLDYAMSVIVARALPDARDGLKPVHRRILYAMYDMGIRPDSAYKKSARIVGEVLGKYHPHGDMTVYEAMARMAQNFSLRYMLVEGQGNFGSIDGDPPAAMRYTEARLAAPSMDMLADIGKNTVDFSSNFDGTLEEPSVLPSAIPNLLVNGATGIAVGMATSIPPHNLGEIADAMIFMLGKWENSDDIGIEDLMRFVKGPDFPTGGVILHEPGEDGLIAAYSTGRGRVTVKASAHLEEMERGRNRIIVNELPYMVNKSSLIERIAELTREGKLEGIIDLRDESDRNGMRIVIELSKTADPEGVLKDLYLHTPMQTTFSIIMLALVAGEPRLLSLKQSMRVYLEHRLEIVRRRSQYDLEKARQRAHILEGLRVALRNLDEVINLIRNAPDAETAQTRLMKRYRLSEIQAQAILDMPLRRLASLERKKIELEYKETLAAIKELEALLKSAKKMRNVVGEELRLVKEDFGDRRKTHIVEVKRGQSLVSLLTTSDLVPEKTLWISITGENLASRTLDEKQPRQTGRDAPLWLVQANSRDTLYLVAENGQASAIPVLALPETSTPSEGTPIHKVSALGEEDHIAAVFSLYQRTGRGEADQILDEWFVMTATRQGFVKKSALSDLPGATAGTFTLVRVNEGDRLGWLALTHGKNHVILVTSAGMAIRFDEEEVRPMGLVAAGVMGIKLPPGEEVVGMDILPQAGEIFMVGSQGHAKRVDPLQFPLQGRYGQGVVAWKLPSKEKIIGLAIGKGATKCILHFAKSLPKACRLDEAPMQGRAARGQRLATVKAGDQITRLTIAWETPRPEQKKRRQAVTPPSSGQLALPLEDQAEAEKSKAAARAGKRTTKRLTKTSAATKKPSPRATLTTTRGVKAKAAKTRKRSKTSAISRSKTAAKAKRGAGATAPARKETGTAPSSGRPPARRRKSKAK